MIPTIGQSGKGENYRYSKRISACQGLGEWGRRGENILSDLVVMDICPYTFVQTHRMDNSRSELKGELQTLGEYVSM